MIFSNFIKKLKIKYLILVILTLDSNCLINGQVETRNIRAYANHFTIPGSFIQSHDDKFITGTSWISGFSNNSNQAIIELGLDEDKHLANTSAIKICAKFDVEITNASSSSTILTNQSLDINYNPGDLTRYKNKSQLIFKDIYNVKVYNVNITSCSSTTANCSSCATTYSLEDVYLQSEISTNRVYAFTYTNTFIQSQITHTLLGNEELRISWPYMKGATEYELAYTFVDNYSLAVNGTQTYMPSSNLFFDLEHDATNIITNRNSYTIPLTYDRGYIIYRIRPLGLDGSLKRIEGAWLPSNPSGTVSSAMFADTINPNFPYKNFNWQVTKTFAEHGKTGIGVSFNDGIGLNHQQLARLNEESKTIVSSTLFDYYARPSIGILPTPLPGLDFKYRFGLNVGVIPGTTTTANFDKKIFDVCVSGSYCSPFGSIMNSSLSLGAANYYSAFNINKEGYQGYLPDAKGFPYSQTFYTNDGLNRVTMQTLPGKTHQLGSGREIKYLYGQPTQTELDRLFGKEAGRASYYQKNYTIDPNGQVSTSYIDVFGRTVATCLSGKSPLNLEQLANMTGTLGLTEKYSVNEWNISNNQEMCKEVTSVFVIPSTSSEQYLYQTTLAGFASTCLTNYCYSCIYDVTLSITDDCGTEYMDYDNNPSTHSGFFNSIGGSVPYAPVACSLSPNMAIITGSTLNTPISVSFTRAGTYTLHKKICVSDKPLNAYTEDFIQNNCGMDYCSIFNNILNSTNFAGCSTLSCNSCTASVSNYTALAATGSVNSIPYTGPLSNGTAEGGSGVSGNGSTNALYTPTLTPEQISKAYETCNLLNRPTDNCSVLTNLLESDFYPGTGQYAATTSTSTNWSISIFNPTNTIFSSGTPITWSTSTNSYSNSVGGPDAVIINGSTVSPQNLSKADFINNFKSSWAKTLVKFHPEYCMLHFYCDIIGPSSNYDNQMKAINHFEAACNSGYLIPFPFTSNSYSPQMSCTTFTDPLTSLYSGAFSSNINTFTNNIAGNTLNSGKNIYEYVVMESTSTISTSTYSYSSGSIGSSACSQDEEWILYRDAYLAQKQITYSNLLTVYLSNPGAMGGPTCGVVPTVAIIRFPDQSSQINSLFNQSGTLTAGAVYSTVTNSTLNLSTTSSSSVIQTYTNAANQFSVTFAPSNTVYTSQCNTACNSYTSAWNFDLTQSCPGFSNATTSTQTAILAAMVEVCKLGCDYKTSMTGASNAAPGLNYTIAAGSSASLVVNNFQQILDYYLGSSVCNSITILQPPPYPSQYSKLNPFVLSGCKCDLILKVAQDFTSTTLPAGVVYEWQLFQAYYGFDLKEYKRLKCLCNQESNNSWYPGYPWTSTQNDNLANQVFYVDEKLMCTSCMSCSDVATVINNLTLPVTCTLSNIVDKINFAYGNQLTALSALNASFGVHTLSTYLDLYKDCAIFSSTNTSVANTFSNTITQQGLDFYKYLNSLAKNKLLNNNRNTNLCTDDQFYLSTLYSGNLPVVPSYSYNYSASSNSLNVTITSSVGSVLNFYLSYPSSYSGTWSWNNIKYLNSFLAFCPAPQQSGANYGFKVNATLSDLSVVVISGSITNHVYPIAYLSSDSYTVPSICPNLPIKGPNPCMVSLISNAHTSAKTIYQNNTSKLAKEFQVKYKDYCYTSLNNAETLNRTYNGADEYNFTLYYYDQAGNLQRSVAPNGADPGLLSTVTSPLSVPSSSLPAYSSTNAVSMNYVSDYHYNSYNEPIQENTIDGGKSLYYYDDVGRLMASQNANQLAVSNTTQQVCSYTLYDNFGRMYQVGQATVAAGSFSFANNYSSFAAIITNTSVTSRNQVTKVFYDAPTTNTLILAAFNGNLQQRLRNRVSYVTYSEAFSTSTSVYDHATYCSYDDNGNVEQLIQHNTMLDPLGQGLKNISYLYELVSGNIVEVCYQSGKSDQFKHRYYYDEDNRLHEVYTSKDNINWDRDAKYFYYEHGPLARVERAEKKVQGTDYFYTIHGWIKGINNDALKATFDGGKDGTTGNKYLSGFNNIHRWIAGDATGYSLNYYNTSTEADYEPIKTFTTGDSNPLLSLSGFTNTPLILGATTATDGPSLFNGNISAMTTSFLDKDPSNSITNNTAFPLLSAFRYDQLNRITKSRTYRSFDISTNTWSTATSSNCDDAFKTNLSYDNNGNILSLFRNGPGPNLSSGTSFNMDNLSYNYYNSNVYSATYQTGATTTYTYLPYNSNKLRCVTDAVSASNYGTDIDNYNCSEFESEAHLNSGGSGYFVMGDVRYAYDARGNLIMDKGEYISNIEWTVDGKVRRITRDHTALQTAGLSKPDIEYIYNNNRQRAVKIVKPHSSTTGSVSTAPNWSFTYYYYDASGNVMATYDRTTTAASTGTNAYVTTFALNEQFIYGSERLAVAKPTNTLNVLKFTSTYPCFESGNNFICINDLIGNTDSPDPYTLTASGYTLDNNLGYKEFELSNHLGNVISTLSDRKIQAEIGLPCVNQFDFNSGVPSAGDINNNNMTLSVSSGSLVVTKQSGVFGTSGINPKFGTNLTPSLTYEVSFDFDPGTLTSADNFVVRPFDVLGYVFYLGSDFISAGSTVPAAGHYNFTYTPTQTGTNIATHVAFNTSGNSTHYFKIDNLKMCVIGASIVSTYSADMVMHTDYYPFGMQMPGRTWTGGDSYRYSHNGHEREDEIYSNAQSAEYWMYDSRIGRRWEIDPVRFAGISPFAVFNNNPIKFKDIKGDLPKWMTNLGDKISKGFSNFKTWFSETKLGKGFDNLKDWANKTWDKMFQGDEKLKKGDKFIGDDGREYSLSCNEGEPVIGHKMSWADRAMIWENNLLRNYGFNGIIWGSSSVGMQFKNYVIDVTKMHGDVGPSIDFSELVDPISALKTKMNGSLPVDPLNNQNAGLGRTKDFAKDASVSDAWMEKPSEQSTGTVLNNPTSDTIIKSEWDNLKTGKVDTFVQTFNKDTFHLKGFKASYSQKPYFK